MTEKPLGKLEEELRVQKEWMDIHLDPLVSSRREVDNLENKVDWSLQKTTYHHVLALNVHGKSSK